MYRGGQQEFASPEEALAVLSHHGVKGMKWGVHKKEETSTRDSAGQLKPSVTTKPTTPIASTRNSSGQLKPSDTAKPALSERKQKSVDQYLKRADVMGTRVSELKLRSGALPRDKRSANENQIKNLQKSQRQALRNAEAVQKGKLTSKQKKVIVGAVAVTALIGITAVVAGPSAIDKGQQSGAFNSWKLLGQARLRGQKTPFTIDKSLSKPMSASELLQKVVKPINPRYSEMGGKMNCRRATYAYELRRRGFDVQATTSWQGRGQSESGVLNALTPGSRNVYRAMSMSESVVAGGFSGRANRDRRPLSQALRSAKIFLDGLDTGGPDGMTPGYGSKKVFEALGKQPNGARGEVLFKFPNFGHSMAYEIVNGVPHVFDSQKGTYHDLTKTVEDKWGSFSGAEIRRLDNAPLDLKFLTRWATNAVDKPQATSRPSVAEVVDKLTPKDKDSISRQQTNVASILRDLGITNITIPK